LITGAALADVWPEVSTRLGKLLTSRGAARDVADDVVQEVAARALSHGIVFDDAADLMRWAVPVALNLLVDHARAAGRVTLGIDGYDTALADVADLVAHRDRLRQVLGAVARLSDADRAALAPEAEAPADRREAVKLAVRRHRARRRLLALVDGVAAFVGWLGVHARRSRVAVTAVPVAFVLPVALVLVSPVLPEQGRDATAAPRVVTPALERAVTVSAPTRATVAPPARPAVAAPKARRVAGTAPAPKPSEVVRVGPKGNGVVVQERRATRSDHLVCVADLPVEDVCVL
jgi:DNA-directed RNA polymerase specialized sigma24 family protein